MLSNETLFEKPKIKLEAYLQGDSSFHPDEIAAYAAMGDKSRESITSLWKRDMGKKKERRDSIINKVLAESYRRGHGSVGDLGQFLFSVEDLTRAATMGLCGPEYLNHEQQSMRFVTADRGYYVPEALREEGILESVRDVLDDSFRIYGAMSEEKIPTQDARFVLPLLSKTNITTEGNVRALHHLESIFERNEAPKHVKYVVNKMIERAENVAPLSFKRTNANTEPLGWRPSRDLYASENNTIQRLIEVYGEGTSLIDYSLFPMTEGEISKAVLDKDESYLANLKNYHFTFLVPLSLSGNHQLIRQRTLHGSDQTIFDVAEKRDISLPPSIKSSSFLGNYSDINNRMMNLYEDLVERGIERSEAIGVVPNSLKIRSLMHVDGHNAIHFIGKRRCSAAQWEIRNVANEIGKIIEEKSPELGKFSIPQCGTYGYCPEKEPCGLEKKYARKNSRNI